MCVHERVPFLGVRGRCMICIWIIDGHSLCMHLSLLFLVGSVQHGSVNLREVLLSYTSAIVSILVHIAFKL